MKGNRSNLTERDNYLSVAVLRLGIIDGEVKFQKYVEKIYNRHYTEVH